MFRLPIVLIMLLSLMLTGLAGASTTPTEVAPLSLAVTQSRQEALPGQSVWYALSFFTRESSDTPLIVTFDTPQSVAHVAHTTGDCTTVGFRTACRLYARDGQPATLWVTVGVPARPMNQWSHLSVVDPIGRTAGGDILVRVLGCPDGGCKQFLPIAGKATP